MPTTPSTGNTPGNRQRAARVPRRTPCSACSSPKPILREFPACSEGELTRLRAALVSRTRMAEFGRALTLGEHILLGKGVEQTFGRERPALLANAAEAVIAAIFLDVQRSEAGDPLDPLRRLLQDHLLGPDLPLLREALAEAPERGALRDAKTLLQELVQAQSAGKLPLSRSRPVRPAP